MAEILPTDSRTRFDTAVKRAVELLRAGEVVALPTETVYGLAANAFDAGAVRKIFEIKGRPANNPVIVHVNGLDMARQCVAEWNGTAEKLARAFWPGPLTIVLPRSRQIPDVITARGETVGVRWPRHPFATAVIGGCGFPLAAPSANRSNEVSPTSAEHVSKSLGEKIALIVDGGQAQVGIESTVIDVSVHPPKVFRPGIIHREALMAVVGEIAGAGEGETHLKSPGMLARHYSPRARLLVRRWRDERDLEKVIADKSTCCIIAHSRIPEPRGYLRVSLIPHDPEAYARALYAELHQCDELGAELIVVEAVPEGAGWEAMADRLRRAEGQ